MRPLELDDLYRFAIPSEPAIAPDGRSVAYVLRTTDREADKDVKAIWLVTGDDRRRIAEGRAPAWSPDGTTLAFVREQIQLLTAGGEPRQVTELPHGAGAPVWSPDGTRIAFSAFVGAAEPGPYVIDHVGYRVDGVGIRRGRHQQLHVLDVASGTVTQVTDAPRDAGDPAWAPDGSRLAFVARADAEEGGLATAAHVLDLASGVVERVGPAGFVETVRWSPAGDALLVVGATEVQIGHLGLLLVTLDSGTVVDLAAPLDRNVRPGHAGWHGGRPQYLSDGRTVAFCVSDHGRTHAYTVDAASPGMPQPLVTDPDVVLAGVSLATEAGVAAVVAIGPRSHGEVMLLDLATGALRPLTTHTATALPEVGWVEPEQRSFAISDGTTVQGWVLRGAADGPSPLHLDVHGGPHLAWGAHQEPAHPYHQLLVAHGFTVLLLNPRGSDGYGEKFYTGEIGAWGFAEEADLLEPVAQLVAEGVADPDRITVGGYSYGGFMVCHLTSRTDVFARAVVGAGLCDLAAATGTSDLSPIYTVLENGALPYTDPELVHSQSPISRVAAVRTPTLLLHGLADDRCPPSQAEQWFTGLRMQGVPAQLVLYPGESHQLIADGTPSSRVDYNRRLVDWATQLLPTEPSAP